MSNENHNNTGNWKSKLEEIESLPGKTFNKEVAWGKLHERMQGKSRNKRAIWYWAAAASLLLALLLPLFLANRKENVLVKNNSARKQIQTSSHQLLTENNKNTTAVISSSSLPVEKKSPVLPVVRSNKIKSLSAHNAIRPGIVQEKKEKEEFITQKMANSAVTPVDTAIRVFAILPEKKKLQVVHINELGEPVAETSNIARYSDHRSSQKIINQQVYRSSLPSGNTGFNFFKTRNIPSN